MIVKTGFTIYLLNAISTSYIYTIIVEQAVSRAVFGVSASLVFSYSNIVQHLTNVF